MATDPINRFILTFDCPSAPGQVAAISAFLDGLSCYIEELAVFDDDLSQRFFVRCVYHSPAGRADLLPQMRREFVPVAERFGMQWAIHDTTERPRVLILVSKLDHCLNDLLYRWRIGELKMEVTAIVSNHPDLKPIADAHGLPYHHSNSHFGEFTRFRVAGEPARSCAA